MITKVFIINFNYYYKTIQNKYKNIDVMKLMIIMKINKIY